MFSSPTVAHLNSQLISPHPSSAHHCVPPRSSPRERAQGHLRNLLARLHMQLICNPHADVRAHCVPSTGTSHLSNKAYRHIANGCVGASANFATCLRCCWFLQRAPRIYRVNATLPWLATCCVKASTGICAETGNEVLDNGTSRRSGSRGCGSKSWIPSSELPSAPRSVSTFASWVMSETRGPFAKAGRLELRKADGKKNA